MNKHVILKRPVELLEAGLISPDRLAEIERVATRYAISITPAMAEIIDPSDPDDPIGRQFVPSEAELHRLPEERDDPIGDDVHEAVPGLVHRYPDRVLLKLANICPVYCRFCFRRESVGPGQPAHMSDAAVEAALAYIAEHSEVWEVIVTGGDPLVLSSRRLAAVASKIAAIKHVKILRWHTRVPLVAPERINTEMVAALKPAGITTWLALHANHPREFTEEGRAAIARLAEAGIPLVSQSVLLRGVNDDPDTLAALMRAFVENRVKPYYLHHGDLAPGTVHFRAGLAEGRALMRTLRGHVSGLCQPTYVLDIPGGHGKVPVGNSYVTQRDDEAWSIEDCGGDRHEYPPVAQE